MQDQSYLFLRNNSLINFATLLGCILMINGTVSFAATPDQPSCQPAPSISLTEVREGWTTFQDRKVAWQMTKKIKNGQVRFSSGDGKSANILMANGDLVTLTDSFDGRSGSKIYIKQSASDLKQIREKSIGKEVSQTIAAQLPVKLSKDGQKKTIDGRKTELYVGSSADGNTRFQYWITIEINDINLVRHALECADQKMNFLQKIPSAENQLPGIVVESISIVNGKEISKSRLVSLSHDPIPDSEFQIPTDYRSLDDLRNQQIKSIGGNGAVVPRYPGMPVIPGVPTQP